ncbi:MAG: hypothetical protein HY400_02925 [Elusimicrobia bacterium]|nr:hypothetical protein [Elusimicrobiota bacterium]
MLVVVLVIAILSGYAVVRYRKTVETSRAEQAVGLLKMVADAHRKWASDNFAAPNPWIASNSRFYTPGVTCPAATPANCSPPINNACELMACGYLSAIDWNPMPYLFCTCNTSSVAGCVFSGAGGPCCGPNIIACIKRRRLSSTEGLLCTTWLAPCVNIGATGDPYNIWEYRVDSNGVITAFGGAPPPPQ